MEETQEGTDADVKVRISKARGTTKSIWNLKELTAQTKVRLFNSNVKSALLYGAETWRTKVVTIKKVQASSIPASERF